MQENELWAGCIQVRTDGDGRWYAFAEFQSVGRFNTGAVCGRVGTLHSEDSLECAVDIVVARAEKMHITFLEFDLGPTVFYANDAMGDSHAPSGWRKLVNDQSRRLGWKPLYNEDFDKEVMDAKE